ncbi:MAG: hypothetical protein KDE27_22355 [Planctomycetes bacterium]|nr:hypothetical protein [Planctomycetota bacterium]
MNDVLTRLLYAAADVLVVAAIVLAVTAALRRRSPRLAALLWLIVPVKVLCSLAFGSLIAFPVGGHEQTTTSAASERRVVEWAPVTPPLPTAKPTADPRPPAASAATSATRETDATAAPASALPSLAAVALSLWALGAIALLARSVRDRVLGARLVRRSTPAPERHRRLAQTHAEVFGVRAPAVRTTRDLRSPALVGTLRPVVLLPESFRDLDDIEWAIRHELMHVVQRDPWAALLHELARIAFFFHPAVWLAASRWDEAAELACDRALVHDAPQSLAYAERLHALAVRMRQRPDPVLRSGLFAARSRVGRRIEALVDDDATPSRPTRSAGAIAALLGAAALLAGTGPAMPAHEFEFAGVVHGPDGAPVADADVSLSVFDPGQWHIVTLRSTRTGADGSFAIGFDSAELPFDRRRYEYSDNVALTVTKDGFAPDWVSTRALERRDAIALHLLEDVPLRGHLVDEDGQPLAGATLRIVTLYAAEAESLDEWQSALEAGTPVRAANATLRKSVQVPDRLAAEAKTDATGAFTLRGVGRDRHAWVRCVGGDAAAIRVRLANRIVDADLLARANRGWAEPVVGADSLVVGQRTRPVEGVVRDDTGAPMAGVEVISEAIAQRGISMVDHGLRTTTDAAGRFRLLGFAKAKGNAILLAPGEDQPFLMREVRLPDPDGMAPIQLEVKLNRGIWITGKVAERGSGAPVPGVVTYHPELTNPVAASIDQFKDRQLDGPGYPTHADGTFRIVGLPGKGLIGFAADREYCMGTGFDPSWKVDERGSLLVLTAGGPEPGPTWPTSMAAVDIPTDATTFACDLQADPGTSIAVEVAAADGAAIDGVEVMGLGSKLTRAKVRGSQFVVGRIGPFETRLVSVYTPDRQLGTIVRLRAGDAPTQRLTLQRAATIRGRMLDQDGAPIGDTSVQLLTLPETQSARSTKTDKDGNFAIEGVLCDSEYCLLLMIPKGMMPRMVTAIDRVEVRPGEVHDLGETKVKLP